MATDAGTIDYLLDQLGGYGGRYTTRRMFGEYCLYREGLPVALVCDDVLFVKDTAPGRALLAADGTPEFGPPYPGARLHLRIAPDGWDDGDALRRLIDATAAALPPPKPRKARPAAATETDVPDAKPRARKAGSDTAPTRPAPKAGRARRSSPKA